MALPEDYMSFNACDACLWRLTNHMAGESKQSLQIERQQSLYNHLKITTITPQFNVDWNLFPKFLPNTCLYSMHASRLLPIRNRLIKCVKLNPWLWGWDFSALLAQERSREAHEIKFFCSIIRNISLLIIACATSENDSEQFIVMKEKVHNVGGCSNLLLNGYLSCYCCVACSTPCPSLRSLTRCRCWRSEWRGIY